MTKFAKESAPHIRTSLTLPSIYWRILLALFPALLAGLILYGEEGVRQIMMALVGGLAAEGMLVFCFRKKTSLADGSTALFVILLALLLPVSITGRTAFFAALAAILIGKEMFGGLGSYPFHPSLIGILFLTVTFSSQLPTAAEKMPDGMRLFWGHEGSVLGEASPFAAILGGVILLWQRLVRWEIPLLYLLPVVLFSVILTDRPGWGLASGGVLLMAFFIVTDAASSPMTRIGDRIFALAAGFFTVLFREVRGFAAPELAAVLCAQALSPWLDHWVRPKGSRRRAARGGS